MNHLVFLHPKELAKILAGTKVVESRLWKTARHPCRYALVGDRLYFKATGGDVQGCSLVQAIEAFHELTPTDIPRLAQQFAAAMACAVDDPYWYEKRFSREARFFSLTLVHAWHIPAQVLPRGVRIGWVADWTPPAAFRPDRL
jgi:hypothetical protein